MPQGSVIPTTGVPPESEFVDPDAQAAENTEHLAVIVRDLNAIRQEISQMMGDDMKESRFPMPVSMGRQQLSIEQSEREEKRRALEQREEHLMKEYRRIRGEALHHHYY